MAGDLISREYLLGVIGKMPVAWEYGKAVEDIWAIIENAPAVNAEEVTLAHWHNSIRSALVRWKDGEVRAQSNTCGFVVPDSLYCPNCGAKMDREENENDENTKLD